MLKYFRGRSFGYVFRFVLAAPLALIIWLCIEIINIFRPVFIVGLSNKGRITQYMRPMELHLRQANQTDEKYLMIFVMPAATPNEAVRTVYRRYSIIIDSHFPNLIRRAFAILAQILKPRFTPELPMWNTLWALEPPTKLDEAEIEFGDNLMKELGIPDGKQYVCLGVKESAYYASIKPKSGYSQDLSHQAKDSRNVEITNYMLAANYLAKFGIYVVRMGSIVGAALPSDRNPLIIDYASEARSELGDLILGRNCKFFICGATGSFIFAAASNKPIIFVDHYFENRNDDPARRLDQLPNSILISRMYRDQDGYLLKFQSIIEQNTKLLLDSRLKEMQIFPVANSATDILDAVSEMNQIVDGTYDATNTDVNLQDKFYGCFVPPFPWREYPLMRVANSFLRKYQDLL